MAPKGKQRQPSEAAAEQVTLLCRYVAVPTDFFDVQTDGQRYLATVKQRHASKAGYVWIKFEADGTQVWVPDATARKWLISDEEAEAEDAEWYEVPPESDEDEEAEPEPAPAAAAASSGSGDVRGSAKSGRWKPAAVKKVDHPVDHIKWKKATGAVPGHQPVLFEREWPPGRTRKEGLQVPCPKTGVHLKLFSAQWDMDCWKLCEKHSKVPPRPA